MNSAEAKWRRARKHLDDLRAEVDAAHAADFTDELTYRVTYPYGDDDERAVVTMRLELRAPLEWSLTIGDILTNLRASLDHAVYGHATARADLNARQRKNLYHPVCMARSEWDGTPEITAPDGTVTAEAKIGAREKLEDLLTTEVLTVIEKNQPFNDPGDKAWNGLVVLSGLVNRDKHRAVLDLPVNIAELALGGSNVQVLSEGSLRIVSEGVVEKEFVVRRAQRPPGASASYKLSLLQTNAEFLEMIEIPNTGERRSFITIMEKLVDSTATYLNELEAAGC